MAYDFSKITDRLFVGAQINSQEDWNEIKAVGVTHIIDAQIERDDRIFEPKNMLGFSILWDPIADDGIHPKPLQWFKNAIEYGIAALSVPKNIVLTHCAAGVNRGPSLAYAILRAQGIQAVEVIGMMHNQRPKVQIAYRQDAEIALKQLGWIK